MTKFRSILSAPLAVIAACALLGAAAPAPTSCQVGFEPMIAVELAWSPKEALRQDRMMQAALHSVTSGVPGKRDVFILSAAFGGEHVFDKEAAGAAEILSRHYGGAGRIIVLSNAAAQLGEDRPAATPDHFSIALAKIGEAMNPEDVLFLFITSHGQHNKGAAIYETQRLQASMSPGRLAAELDDAGIKNRVLIISACFAGYYIPALQNDDTAILTAASSERTSFGCQPERDWTYFGDALFANALSNGSTLLDGFEQAKTLIQKWEADQGVTPSQPSSDVGKNANIFLAELEKRRPKAAPSGGH